MISDPLIFSWFAALSRCAGCLMLLPGFSSARVPIQIRVLLVLALSVSIAPFSEPSTPSIQVAGSLQMTSIIAVETMIGAMLAASVRIFLLAISFFATAISSAIGLSGQLGASMVEAEVEPALSTLLSMAMLLLLFALDFHHSIIAALAASYVLVPLGAPVDPPVLARHFTEMLSDGFASTFRLASPFLAFAFLANFFIALVNKLAPNLQLYFVAAPAVIIGGIVLAGLVVPVLIPMAGEAISQTLRLP
jgi:flagellar biosynthesis protein FliR